MSAADRIFDAFRDLSAKIHRADAERERIEHLRERAARECGNCEQWMKSRECPIDDQRRGFPSMRHPACVRFTPTRSAIEAAQELAQ